MCRATVRDDGNERSSVCLCDPAEADLSLSLCPADSYARVAFDVLVAVVCGLSLVLCGRSILRGIVLQGVRRAL